MDEIVGLVVEGIAQRVRRAAAEAEERRRIAAAIAAPVVRPVLAAPPAPAAPAPAAQRRPVVSAPPPATGAAPLAASDALPRGVFEAASVARPAAGLLAAFGGGTDLLRALIVAEALAPPIALRPHRPPER